MGACSRASTFMNYGYYMPRDISGPRLYRTWRAATQLNKDSSTVQRLGSRQHRSRKKGGVIHRHLQYAICDDIEIPTVWTKYDIIQTLHTSPSLHERILLSTGSEILVAPAKRDDYQRTATRMEGRWGCNMMLRTDHLLPWKSC